jgi:hypothetical protein
VVREEELEDEKERGLSPRPPPIPTFPPFAPISTADRDVDLRDADALREIARRRGR